MAEGTSFLLTMYLLYADEANVDPDASDFFVYAGVAVPGQAAGGLSSTIEVLRAKYAYRPSDVLKFNTRERPQHVSADAHRDIKREVVQAAADHGVKLFASFILHDVATSPADARRNEINRICYHFDCYMGWVKDVGLVLLDTFNDPALSGILREKFAVGVKGLPFSPLHRLERVLGFHLAAIGTSHFCSVVDVVVGSLRWAINARRDRSKVKTAKLLIAQLAPLCIRDSYSGKVHRLSIFFSPKVIRAATYLRAYEELHVFFYEGGIDAAQVPSGH